MTFIGLPRLTPDTVTTARARQDKIELTLGRWFFNPADEEQHEQFLWNLSRGGVGAPIAPSWFAHPTGRAFERRLAVRNGGSGRGRRVGVPLLAGHLLSRRTPASSPSYPLGTRFLQFDGAINPTRYVNHQQHRPWAHQNPDAWQLNPPSLETRLVLSRIGEEIVLDGSDNVLLSRFAHIFAGQWERHINRYWNGLRGALHAQIEWAAQNSGLSMEFVPQLTIRSVETYWEYRVEDAVSWVAEAEPRIAALGRASEARTRDYPSGDIGADAQVNSRRILARLRAGTNLRVYAKTNKRVRFEIVHNLLENRHIVSERNRQGSTFEILPSCLLECTHVAADELSRCLATIVDEGTQTSEQMSLIQLVHRVVRCGRNEQEVNDTETVLSILASQGYVALSVQSNLRIPIQRLVDAGILQRIAPRHPHFHFSDIYRAAGRQLLNAIRNSDAT